MATSRFYLLIRDDQRALCEQQMRNLWSDQLFQFTRQACLGGQDGPTTHWLVGHQLTDPMQDSLGMLSLNHSTFRHIAYMIPPSRVESISPEDWIAQFGLKIIEDTPTAPAPNPE